MLIKIVWTAYPRTGGAILSLVGENHTSTSLRNAGIKQPAALQQAAKTITIHSNTERESEVKREHTCGCHMIYSCRSVRRRVSAFTAALRWMHRRNNPKKHRLSFIPGASLQSICRWVPNWPSFAVRASAGESESSRASEREREKKGE